MDTDFHYHCIKTLAITAGFTNDEAQILASASQFVDDSLLTCYENWFQHLTKGMTRNEQVKIYVPFHYLPPIPYDSSRNGKPFDFVVEPNSEFARLLVNQAIEFYRKIPEPESLIKLGISLHTYADTWSHKGFSGIWSNDNDIDEIYILHRGLWKFRFIGNMNRCKHRFMAHIGHAGAIDLPDMSHLSFKYRHFKSDETVIRHNTVEFLEAARNIFYILCSVRGSSAEFPHREIKACLAAETDKSERWKQQFPDTGFDYRPDEWKNSLLSEYFAVFALAQQREVIRRLPDEFQIPGFLRNEAA